MMKKMKVATTLDAQLWRNLEIEARKEGRNANDILEELVVDYLKRKGGRR